MRRALRSRARDSEQACNVAEHWMLAIKGMKEVQVLCQLCQRRLALHHAKGFPLHLLQKPLEMDNRPA
jgi:hypothetical protein